MIAMKADLEVISAANADIDEKVSSPHFNHMGRSESQELLTAVTNTITNLFKLAVIIRSSQIPHSFLKGASYYSYDSQYDCSHVENRFPKASERFPWLIERLGKAITMRRQVLQYRREY